MERTSESEFMILRPGKTYNIIQKMDAFRFANILHRLPDCMVAAKTAKAKLRLIDVVVQITHRNATNPPLLHFPYVPLQISKNIIPSRKPSLWNKLKNFLFKNI